MSIPHVHVIPFGIQKVGTRVDNSAPARRGVGPALCHATRPADLAHAARRASDPYDYVDCCIDMHAKAWNALAFHTLVRGTLSTLNTLNNEIYSCDIGLVISRFSFYLGLRTSSDMIIMS